MLSNREKAIRWDCREKAERAMPWAIGVLYAVLMYVSEWTAKYQYGVDLGEWAWRWGMVLVGLGVGCVVGWMYFALLRLLRMPFEAYYRRKHNKAHPCDDPVAGPDQA